MGDEEVKATIAGVPVSVKGIAALTVVVLAVALGAVIYLTIWKNGSEHKQWGKQQSEEHEGLVEALDSINTTNQRIGELLDEQNYIVLSDDKERQAMKIKLRRPSSLSKKLKVDHDE